MKKNNCITKGCLGLMITCMLVHVNKANAQEAIEVSVGGDLVSSYIWRGQDCAGVSIQPDITLSLKGFSLTAWGSVGLDNEDTKEFDFILGYGIGGFNIALTDYWFNTHRYFDYSAHTTSHMFEATVGYDFGPLALQWNTYFAGGDYTKENGDRGYSTYIEASAPFALGGIDFNAEIGCTPWEGLYSDKFNVVNIGLKAGKEIKITETFNLPVFAKMTFNPYTDNAYFVFGVSL